MAEVTETLLVQKLERNSWRSTENTDNFKEDKELTVEITLAEYRSLIKDNAESSYKLNNANNKISELEKEIKVLKNTIDSYENFVKDIKVCKVDENKSGDE